jgi:reactive intermediate/imine deaminase
MSKQAIETPNAPAAIGTYSQGIRAGGALWLSGQLPIDPATGQLLGGEMREQVRQVFRNLAAVAEAAGSSLDHAVKVTVFLTDLGHFAVVNEVMAEFFSKPFPARAAIGVASLPRGAPRRSSSRGVSAISSARRAQIRKLSPR